MLKRVFGRSAADEPDEAALLEELRAQVDKDTLQAYSGTSELPSGAEAEPQQLNSLLLRYLHAEKRTVEKALTRLRKQATWRRGFGNPSEVMMAQRRRCRAASFYLHTCESVNCCCRRTLPPMWQPAR
jgi:DNA-binding transcriptional regulator YbjK